MHKRFVIETIIENGHGHYKVTDNISGNVIHCEFNELNDTIYELLEWRWFYECVGNSSFNGLDSDRIY